MELEEVNEKSTQLKEKYWKPEWDSMSEDDKMKDYQYVCYLYEMLIFGLEFSKSMRRKCSSCETKCVLDRFHEQYEDLLKYLIKT